MPMPQPLPDRIEIAEYLAQYMLRNIELGGLTDDDLVNSPEVGCLEEVVRLEANVPCSIAEVLGMAGAVGRLRPPFPFH